MNVALSRSWGTPALREGRGNCPPPSRGAGVPQLCERGAGTSVAKLGYPNSARGGWVIPSTMSAGTSPNLGVEGGGWVKANLDFFGPCPAASFGHNQSLSVASSFWLRAFLSSNHPHGLSFAFVSGHGGDEAEECVCLAVECGGERRGCESEGCW